MAVLLPIPETCRFVGGSGGTVIVLDSNAWTKLEKLSSLLCQKNFFHFGYCMVGNFCE